VKRFLAILFALYAPLAFADEHLVPEDNQFTRAALPNGQGSLAPYYEMVLALMGQAYTPDVRVRVIAMPADSPEYAIGVREKDGAYSIFHLALKTNIWKYETLKDVKDLDLADVARSLGPDIANAIAEMKASVPADFRDVETVSCETPVDAALGARIVDLWHRMLLRTRFAPSRDLGPAGTDYHFSMRGTGQSLSGKAWEPPPESEAGRFVGITRTMRDVCVTGDARIVEQELRPKIEALLAQIAG
jgi:hypothetical protein